MSRKGTVASTWALFGFVLASSTLLAACPSETASTQEGPAACVAAGGRCMVGPATTCAKVGPEDCNPDRNPGGSVCCLEEKAGPDATGDAVDATSDPSDAAHVIADADAPRFCSTPLVPGMTPATLNDVPFARWCAGNPGRVSEWTCNGVVAVTIGVGVDCHEQHFFDAASKKLVAVVQGCNVGRGTCVAGNPDFVPPQECLGGNSAIDVVNVCVEGGLTTMPPDGASGPCANDSQCPTGYRCGYFTNNGCGGPAQCFYGDFVDNPTCEHETRCACDGTLTEGCVGPWGGFTLKPVPTRDSGPCTE